MDTWKLIYDRWDPENEPLRESLCALGNGHFVTRGAAEESTANEFHYPGTYIAGGYNRATTHMAGHDLENEDLVNWPNWLPLTFRMDGGDWFDLRHVEVIRYRQELDLQRGLLEREIRFRTSDQRETELNGCSTPSGTRKTGSIVWCAPASRASKSPRPRGRWSGPGSNSWSRRGRP
jgi:trehalose/maltose hydrolase-like predicted phosphorylase